MIEIICSSCGADALLKREAVFDGFKKTGERLSCGSCGHEFPDEESVPWKDRPATADIFSKDDLNEVPDLFDEDEKNRNCRHCRHYTVNPFMQRCGLHCNEVQATDICDDFEPPDPESGEDESSQGE